jgi:tetratricopeptide (TPR) repeat protein
MEEYAAAKDHVRQALHSCQRFGKLRGELLCLRNLGAIYLFAGQYATARQLYEQVLDYTDTLGYRWAAGINLVEFGVAVQMLGEYGLAGSLLEQGRALTHEIGDEYNECKALVMLARLYSYLGAYEQAHAWLNQASTYINDSRNNTINKEELIVRAVLANQRGDHLQALAAAMHAWQSAGETESRSDRARMLVFLGHAQAGLHQWSAAVDSYRQAFTLYCQVDKRAQAVEASAGLAAVALAQGELESALEAVEAILPVLDEHLQVGIDEPFYTYWVCHQVLTAHQDVRAAMILHLAHTRLQNYIEHIPDETLRRSFLEHVPVHRALHETYQNHQTTPTPKPHPTSFVET